MGLLRPAARVLDAWGALILGVAVVLAVITLLAMPGPWREVVGAPPAAAPAAARDVAVFVRAGAGGEVCTAAVWLHVEHDRPSLTAVVVPVQLQVAVPGAGYDRLCRVVRLFGGEAAAAALGESLGVPFAGSVTLSAEGLSAAVPTMFPAGDSPRERRRRRTSLRAWTERGPAVEGFRRQTRLLDEALPRVPFESLSVVAVANYALGSEFAESDLDLQEATALAESAREVRAHDVAVRALPVVREVRGDGAFWRPRPGAADRLATSLRLGLWPPRTSVAVATGTRPGGVVVALPAAMDAVSGARFVTGVRDAVAASAGPGVDVATVRYGPSSLTASLAAAMSESRPLAVVLVSGVEGGSEGDGEEGRRETAACAARLRELYQPAVLVVPVAAAERVAEPDVPGELEATGLPLVAVGVPPEAGAGPVPEASPGVVPTVSPSGTTAAAPTAGPVSWEEAGRLAAAATVRACWPAVLAPDLPGTVRGVTYAERRTVEVAVVGDGQATTDLLVWLAVCGYRPALAGDVWTLEDGTARVAYAPGLRRGALAVAGDLSVPEVLVAEEEGVPAPVTVLP